LFDHTFPKLRNHRTHQTPLPPPACRYDQPYQYALYCLGVLLEARRWHVADYEAALPELEPGQLEAFFPRLFSRCQVEMLAAGNLDAAAATDFARQLEAALRER
jgi:insulysin